MTLDQLRIFLEVATYEHVTRAAQTLNMTQSAISAAVASLEARHRVRLFNRVGRRIELTEAGRLFMAEARGVLRRAEDAERFLADLSGSASGTLRLHASQTVASYWLPGRLVSYRERYPRVDLQLVIGNTKTVADAVSEGAADIGVVEGAVESAELIQEVVAQDEIALLVSASHPWSQREEVHVSELSATTWIMREPGSGTRAAFENEMRARGADPARLPIVLELPSNEACMAALQVGRSATVLSRRAALPRLADGSMREIGFSLPARDFTMLRHGERHAAKAAQAMAELLRQPEAARTV